jgi:hypothetical protein
MGKKKSIVHRYFKVDEKDSHTFHCTLCDYFTTITDVSSTSTRKQHLRKAHKDDVVELKEPVERTQPVLPFKPAAMSSSAKKKTDEALLEFIISDMQPFNVVDAIAFVKYSATLNASYQLPCRQTVTSWYVMYLFSLIKVTHMIKRMDVAFAKVKTLLHKSITEGALSVCLTYDPWTSMAKEGYMDVTVHYIDSQSNPHNRCAGIEHLQRSHTGELIAGVVAGVLALYKIPLEAQTTGILRTLIIRLFLI